MKNDSLLWGASLGWTIFFLELKLYNWFKHTKHKSRWVLCRDFWTDLQWGEMNTVVGSPWIHYYHDLDFVWGFLCFVPCFVSYMFSEVLYRGCFQSSTWYMATLCCLFLLLLLLVLPPKPQSSPSWTLATPPAEQPPEPEPEPELPSTAHYLCYIIHSFQPFPCLCVCFWVQQTTNNKQTTYRP